MGDDNTTLTPSDLGQGQSPLWEVAENLDRISSLATLALGIPGNLLAFAVFWSFPGSTTTFYFLSLTLLDMLALSLQVMMRVFVWYDIVEIDSQHVNSGWKLLFNFTYYTGILANWTLVWLSAERLISVAWPDQVGIYLTQMRGRLNIALQAMLTYSFGLIVTVKMDYFGVAWMVIFTTFYTVSPQVIIFGMSFILGKFLLKVKRRQDFRHSMRHNDHHNNHHHNKHHHHHKKHSDSHSGSHMDSGDEDARSVIEVAVTNSLMQRSQSDDGDFRLHPFDAPPKSLSASNQYLSRSHGHLSNAGSKCSLEPKSPSKLKKAICKLQNGSEETLEKFEEDQRAEAVAHLKEQVDIEICYTVMYLVCSVFFFALSLPHSIGHIKYVLAGIDRIPIGNDKYAELYLLMVISLACMYCNHSLKCYFYIASSSRFRRQIFVALCNMARTVRSWCRRGRRPKHMMEEVRITVEQVELDSTEGEMNPLPTDV